MSSGSDFPISLDTFTDKVDGVDKILVVETNKQSSAIEKLQIKVGITGSVDTNSLDYKIGHAITNVTVNKGDILVNNGSIVTNLSVSGNYSVLVSDSTAPKGITWSTIPTLNGVNLPNTSYASQIGLIYKNSAPFIHDFNYGNNGSIITNGKNTFLGTSAGNFSMGSSATVVTESSQNTGIGYGVLTNATKAYDATAIGVNALNSLTVGEYNTAVGVSSLGNLTDGAYNTAIGHNAGLFLTGGVTANVTADYSVYIGKDTKAKAHGDQNEIVIGYNTVGNGSNTATWGNINITNHYFSGVINTTSFMITPSSLPTSDYQVANKKYVDSASAPAVNDVQNILASHIFS